MVYNARSYKDTAKVFLSLSPTLRKSLLPPYSGYKRSHFYPEDGGSRFIQNAGNYLPDYMATHPKTIILIANESHENLISHDSCYVIMSIKTINNIF
jgi:hypothetical protein